MKKPSSKLQNNVYSCNRVFTKDEPIVPILPQDSNKYLQIVDNNIYFNAEINAETSLVLMSALRNLTYNFLPQADLQTQQVKYNVINLFINSPGGSVDNGLAIYDEIQMLKQFIVINTVVNGNASSSATLILMAGSRKFMKKHSNIMLHQLSYTMWGKLQEHHNEIKIADFMQTQINNLYLKHSKIKKKQLDEILKKDSYFFAEEALTLGLVDEII